MSICKARYSTFYCLYVIFSKLWPKWLGLFYTWRMKC